MLHFKERKTCFIYEVPLNLNHCSHFYDIPLEMNSTLTPHILNLSPRNQSNKDLDMLAAQLNELGISPQQSQSQPEAPPRSNRSQPAAAIAVKESTQSNNNNNQQVNPLDPIETSDSDSEPDEPNDRTRNDGTLLASDPPKPL